VLSRFAADFRQPTPDEGYQQILYVKPSDQLSSIYSRSDVAVILHRVQDSPAVVSEGDRNDLKPGFSESSFRGNANRGYHHGWGKPYPWAPIVNHGLSNFFPDWQKAPYRGNSVGLQGSRGVLPYPEILKKQSNSSEVARPGSMQNPFVID